MGLPLPEPGLVLSYAYLWLREQRAGRAEGRKDRPCIIVLAVATGGSGPPIVTVVPVTHSRPARRADGMALPPRVMAALGLDDEPSWVMVDEVNQFSWPGFDIRPVPGRRGHFHYGFIPPRLYDRIRDTILARAAERRIGIVDRD